MSDHSGFSALSSIVPNTTNTYNLGSSSLLWANIYTTALQVGSLSGILKASAGLVAGSATTSDLPEGSSLYYTDERVDDRVSALILGTTNQITSTYDDTANSLTLALPQNIHTEATPTFAGLNLGSGTLSTVGNVSLDSTAVRDVTVARHATSAGVDLTIQAGGAVNGGLNILGGNLLLTSGISTGSSRSAVVIKVPVSGGSGTTDRSPANAFAFFSTSSGLPTMTIGTVSLSTTGLPFSTNTIGFSGQGAAGITAYRHTTSNTAGNSMTMQAAGATSGATDKAGGNLIINSGIATGTAYSYIQHKTYSPVNASAVPLASGTTDGQQIDRLTIGAFKALTDGSPINLVNFTLASNTVIGAIIRYAVEVFDGTNLQMETGEIMVQCANKGGVFSGNTITQVGSAKQFLGSGTLSMTWAITGANPAVLSLNADTSLTASTGYPRITYTIDNLTQQAIAIQ